jgi:hypothetical protein
MTDQDRRAEILKAEAAVRLLAEELSRAKQTHLEAEKVARSLATAQATLEQSAGASQTAVQRVTEEAFNRLAATQVLLEQSLRGNQAAIQAVEGCAKDAQASLQDARDRLETLEKQVATRIRELRTAVEHLDGLASLVQKTVEQRMADVEKEIGALRYEHAAASETSQRKMRSMGRVIVVLVILAVLSVGSSIGCLLAVLIWKG